TMQPRSLGVVAGGYTAMECAHVFGGLGTAVTVVNRSEALLRWLDTDLSARFNKQARERFNVIPHVNVSDVEDTANGIKATLDNGVVLEQMPSWLLQAVSPMVIR